MNVIFSKFKLWSKRMRFFFVISIFISIYCILSIISYALASSDVKLDSITLNIVSQLLNGIGMSVIAILLFRLISLTYFDKEGVGKIEITLTAIYSQFGIYVFLYFMTGFKEEYFYNLYNLKETLKYAILTSYPGAPPYNGWLLFENILEILSIVIVIIIIFQILYLQYSQNKRTTSAVYWKVVIYLAVVFCAAYILVTSLPNLFIPVTGGKADDSVIVYITAITGLISAVTALYTQILAGKKLNMEMELLKAQNNSLKGAKGSKNKAARKSTKQRKS